MRAFTVLFFLFCMACQRAEAQSCTDRASALKLSGGLEASIGVVGRSPRKDFISISIQLENKGKFPIQLLLVAPEPHAADNAGMVYGYRSFSGVAACQRLAVDAVSGCLNGEGGYKNLMVPLNEFTQVDPGSTAALTFGLSGSASEATTIGFSSVFAYRIVSDPIKDEALPEKERRRSLRTMSVSFGSCPITQKN